MIVARLGRLRPVDVGASTHCGERVSSQEATSRDKVCGEERLWERPRSVEHETDQSRIAPARVDGGLEVGRPVATMFAKGGNGGVGRGARKKPLEAKWKTKLLIISRQTWRRHASTFLLPSAYE
jgi:hypothetical protein